MKNSTLAALAACLISLPLSGCMKRLYFDFEPPIVCRHTGPMTGSVFLIGDAGAPELPDANAADPTALVDPVLVSLAEHVAERVGRLGTANTGVVVLGDNVYPAGLPPEGEKGHERAKRILDAQVAAIGEARGMFTLGNHDWVQGKAPQGWIRAKAQHDYLSSRGDNISVHPAEGCAGPQDVNFGKHLHIVFLDVWATFYQIKYPDGPQGHCTPTAGSGAIRQEVDRMLGDTGQRRALFVAHPPMLTSGPHGGYFPWREHLFPFRAFNRNLWIPLPVLGSIFPLARMLGVTDTDMMSANYQNFLQGAKDLFSPGHPTLVAAGHEHSLQVHVDPTGVFHAVSGAGSVGKVDYVRRMRSDLMALAAPGYMRLDVYDDATLRLEVLALDENLETDLVFSTCIP